MIKASARTGLGEPMLFLGLSGENVTRLTAGEPIMITSAQLSELGLPPMVIAIHYGRTESAILAEIKAHGITVQPSITCPSCRKTSYNPNDVRERYCGNCHLFHDLMTKRTS